MADHDGLPGPAPGPRPAPAMLATWLLGGLLAIALIWFLRAAAAVTLPLVCGILIALAVMPVAAAVRRAVPKPLAWLGHVAAMAVVIAFLALFVGGISLAAHQVAAQAGALLPRLQQAVAGAPLAGLFDGPLSPERLLGSLSGYATAIVRSAGAILSGIVLIFFLTLLVLTEVDDWRAKTAAAFGDGRRWAESAEAVGQRFRRYFLARLLLGALTGLLYAAWLALFGMPLLLVWAMLALLLNFIPTVGSLIAGALPVLFAFALRDVGTAAGIAVGLLAIEQVIGNLVDPRVMGRQLSLSPLIVLVSLLLWTWVWGLAGALIAVPTTVLLTIAFAHVPKLRRVALLFSNERDLDGLAAVTAPR
jgi:AI-2 transport protein TqsA